jgi:hypothetical protein
MNSKSRSPIHLLVVSFIVLASLTTLAPSAVGQNGEYNHSAVLFCCLKKKWPNVRIDERSKMVFIPETGQNLAWDKDKRAWVDVKTLKPVWGACQNLSEASFVCCLKKKWPDVRIDERSKMVFVPETGQNLAWDKGKQAWVDVKTGKCICPECPGQTAENVLKTIGRSIHVDIGLGGGGYTSGHDEHHHERRGSSSSTHKTVTSGCKCHPCTCSPCTCH